MRDGVSVLTLLIPLCIEVTYGSGIRPGGSISSPELAKLRRAELPAHGNSFGSIRRNRVLKLLGKHGLLLLLLKNLLLLNNRNLGVRTGPMLVRSKRYLQFPSHSHLHSM